MTPRSLPRWSITLTLAAASGLLLFASDFPLHLWPIQAVALVPWLMGLARHCDRGRLAGLAGIVLALSMLIPMTLVLDLPLPMTLVLVAVIGMLWAVMSFGIYRVLRWRPPWGVLAAAGVAVLTECLNVYLLPIWGTAQCFARVWSAGPWFIQLVELTGITGLVFVLVASQAALVQATVGPQADRRAHVVCLVVLVGTVAAINTWRWPLHVETTLRVGALGWVAGDQQAAGPVPADTVLDTLYEPLLRSAAARGARLVVSPEAGMRLTAADHAHILDRLGALARRHGTALVVGYFDAARHDNRIVFIDATGRARKEYVKTHLVPTLERYKPGDGVPVVWNALGVPVGGMICQDDNFTDLSRAYGRQGVQVMAVPTNDWRKVQHHHLENSIFRSVENRYGVIRATSQGISAIISPRGEILARADHYDVGPQAIVADLPVLGRSTLYSRAGEWLAALAAALVVLPGVWSLKRSRRNGRAS